MVDVAAKLAVHAELQSLRQTHEQVWRECYEYTHPARAQGFNGEAGDANAAQSKQARLTDSTAPDSCLILASAIQSGMTPANTRWFGLAVDGADEDSRLWLEDAARVLWNNIHMANFDSAGFECSLDAVEAGWFCLYVEEDREKGGLRFEQWPIYQVYAASSRYGGDIDIVHRRYKLTALQCLSEFGSDNLSEAVRKLAAEKPHEKVELLHVIEPRPGHVTDSKLSKNLPIASYHIEIKGRHLVRESGYHEMPVMAPRMTLIPDSCYATGPMSVALPVAKRLNELCRMQLAAADLAVAGMWIAEDDGILNPRTVKVGPRKVIVAASVDSMKPLLTGSDFNISLEVMSAMQGAIRKILMADALPPADGPAKTAYEYSVRLNMLRQLLGPMFGRLQAEYLSPLVVRCFGVAFRAGVFADPPESLGGQSFSVKYLGPLARSQKLEEANAIGQVVAETMQIAQAMPEIADNIDFDEATRLRVEAMGVPAAVLRKREQVTELRQARADAQQQAMEQEQMAELGQVAGQEVIKKAVKG